MQLLNVFKLLLFNLCAVRCKYVEAINLRMFDSPSEVVRRTTIHHFHIDHKAPCSPPPPILLVRLSYPGEIGKNSYATFWGETRCIMVSVKIANS